MTYQTVVTSDALCRFVDQIRNVGRMAIEIVTTSPEPMRADIVGMALARTPGEAIYVPVAHVTGENMDVDTVMDVLKPVLENEEIEKIGLNIKDDVVVLHSVDIQLNGLTFDPMLAAYLMDPGRGAYTLKALSEAWLDISAAPIEDLIGKGKKQIGFEEVAIDDARNYVCANVDLVLQLHGVLMAELEELELTSLFQKVEMPLVSVLADMEYTGVAVDVPFLEAMASTLSFELDRLTDEIYDVAGEPFNLNSPKQLAHVLFEKLMLPAGRKTKTGYSTDQSVLERLAMLHPVPAKVLAYREIAKLQSTYVEVLPQLVHPETGRIHASFNQAVTATGRLSVSNPNLQNIPVRTALGQEIRKAFVPGRSGWKLISVDYSQLELRIMAHLSGDEGLIEAFESGVDVHRHTASVIFDLAPEYVVDEMRERAKTVNYGVMYGMSPFGLAQQLGLTVGEARAFIARYFSTYPGVRAYIDETIALARELGYVETMLGRRRYVPEIVSVQTRKREAAERMAVNTPIQGTASDLIKVAMVRIYEGFKRKDLQAQMLLQVHDELLFEAPENEIDRVCDLVQNEMRTALCLDVPVEVSVGIGNNWLDAH